MVTYTIQCYIETLSSDDKISLHGAEGFRLLKDERIGQDRTIQKTYLVFFENGANVSKPLMIEQSTNFNLRFSENSSKKSKQPLELIIELHSRQKMEAMLLAAQTNHKKVELEIELIDNEATLILKKIKLMK